ncbi:MAG: Maf family protein [Negativicutes bacterium]|nr:Maf family protein [Negativicutes bacterium]
MIYLASSSPRRRELLAMAGIDFRVVESRYREEDGGDRAPAGLAVAHAEGKAKAAVVPELQAGDAVLAADTIVVCRGRVLGKPRDSGQAAEYLRRLRGSWHRVITAVAVRTPAGMTSDWQATRVKMTDFDDDELAAYVATGESLDKAGGYGLQGRAATFVAAVDGCYSNVIGLPLPLTLAMLKRCGCRPAIGDNGG